MDSLEFKKYKKFIGEFYPESGIIEDSSIKNIYSVINNNINFMKLVQKIDNTINIERSKLYKDFYFIHLRVLYHIPSNDVFINNILVRLVSENILRLVVSFLSPNCASISSMSYSQMIEELNGKGFPRRYAGLHHSLTNIFGRYSQDVHGETIHRYSEEYLLMIRRKVNTSSLSSLANVYKGINKEIIPFFLKELSIKKDEIETPLLSEMLKLIGEENYNNFF